MGTIGKTTHHYHGQEHHSLHVIAPRWKGLEELEWELLLGRIRDKECTVFIGAGANSGILPTGEDVARKWATKYEYPLDVYELPKIAQFIVEKTDSRFSKDELMRLFAEQLRGLDLTQRISTSPLRFLARLPIPIYLTTNYDDFMFRALTLEKGKKPKTEICAWNNAISEARAGLHGAKRNKFNETFGPFLDGSPRFNPTPDSPVVFHLHGHELLPASLVLTEDDYYDFLIRWSEKPKIIPPRIQQALSSTSLLFVGYRLADLSFGVVFRSKLLRLREGTRRLHVAVQSPDKKNPRATEYWTDYFHKRNIRVYWGEASEFTEELSERWRKWQ